MDEVERLTRLFQRLAPADRETLLAFAEFLAGRSGAAAEPVAARPEPVARPADESVVAAIKRLSAVYHMVDRSKMLHETSALMAQHIMQGREAGAVIDDLELLFLRHYERQYGGRGEAE
jgi:hypothetical protein